MSIRFVSQTAYAPCAEIRAFSLSLQPLLQAELNQKKRPILKKLFGLLSTQEQSEALNHLKAGNDAWLSHSDELLFKILVEKIHVNLSAGQGSPYFLKFIAIFMHYYDLSSSINLLHDNLFYANYELRSEIKDYAEKLRRLENVSQQFIPTTKKWMLIWKKFFSENEESYSVTSRVAKYLNELSSQKKWPVSVPLTEIAAYLGVPLMVYENGILENNLLKPVAVQVNKNNLNHWSAIFPVL